MHKLIMIIFFGALSFAFYNVASAEITFVSWGGSYSEAQKKALVDTWPRKHLINMVDYNGGLGEIRTQIETGNIMWDVVDVFPNELITGCEEGLFERLPQAKFPKAPNGNTMLKDIKKSGVKFKIPKCAAPMVLTSTVVFYDPPAFLGRKPKTIKDFFDTKKFPGKRGIPTWPEGVIEMALMASGVKKTKVYKVLKSKKGLNRAFNKLDSIKGDIIFWSSGNTPLDLIDYGEAVMAVGWNGRIGDAILNNNKNYKYIWDGAVVETQFLAILKGSRNYKRALSFVKHATSPRSLARMAKWVTYPSMRKSSIDFIRKREPYFYTGDNVLPHLSNAPKTLRKTLASDPYFWKERGKNINKRWTRWLAK